MSDTPITDRHRSRINSVIGEVVPSHVCEDLERQLAESKSSLELQRELNTLQRGEINKLRDKLAKSDHEIERLRAAVDEGNIAELNRQLAEAQGRVWANMESVAILMGQRDGAIHRESESRQECEEQARLLGMSSEREARLIAERDEARDELRKLRVENDHNWQANEMAETAFKERDEARAQCDALVDVLALVGRAIPADRSTTKTCYAINDDIRDTVHKTIAAVKENKSKPQSPTE